MSPVLFLVAALVGLALGPAVFAALHRAPAWQLGVDGFVLVAVVGLVAFHVLPEAVEVAGFWSLAAAGAGLLLPLAVERVRALSSDASHAVVLAVAFSALLLHASIDGVGLGTAHGSSALAVAIVLHRLPVGLAVWWLVRPQFGRGWAALLLAALGAATVAGFAVETAILAPAAASKWVMFVQAFVAGSLLHVLLHQSVGFHDHEAHDGWRFPGTIGATLGIAVAAGLPLPGEPTFAADVLRVSLVAAPLIVPLVGLGIAVAIVRHPGRPRIAVTLEILDGVAPWTLVALVVAAMVAHGVEAPGGAVHWVAVIALGASILVALAHSGPRDFMLEIFPGDFLVHDHHHEHADDDTSSSPVDTEVVT